VAMFAVLIWNPVGTPSSQISAMSQQEKGGAGKYTESVHENEKLSLSYGYVYTLQTTSICVFRK